MGLDPGELERSLATHRRELVAHCYRITGSLSDAEDAVQEAYVRAWNAMDSFQGRASTQRWLYTIASRTSLDVVSRRRARSLPLFAVAPGDPAAMPPPEAEPVWLEPIPDEWLVDAAPGPEARISARESVALAFLATLQALPVRQRAALILRDVAGYTAEETGDILELTVPAVNSALQRARETLAARDHPAPDPRPDPGLLARFVEAVETRDADALVALLKQDAALSMPPFPYWLRGREHIRAFFADVVFARPQMRTQKLLEVAANGCPAFAGYARDERGVFVPAVLDVLVVRGGAVAELHSFLVLEPGPLSFARFGLPPALDEVHPGETHSG